MFFIYCTFIYCTFIYYTFIYFSCTVICTFHILSYIVLCPFYILSYTMYFSYTVLFHILSSCTFNCILSSCPFNCILSSCTFNCILSLHSSTMLLISCHILYAFHLHILVIYFSLSYAVLVHIFSSCTLYFPYTVIYSSLSFSYTFIYYVLSYTVLFHILSYCTFNCILSHIMSYILYISFPFRFHVCIYLRSGYGK